MDVDDLAKLYISRAEMLFGPMCSDWIYRGVEFNDMGPHLRYYIETREVAISLSEKARNDTVQLHFQLSHEVCHLLYPTTCIETSNHEKTTILNEGVSTYFSILAIEQFSVVNEMVKNLKVNNPNYYDALLWIGELLKLDEQAIFKLRTVQPKLNQVKPHDFEKAGLDIPLEIISKLLNTFS